jgi:hypothetical protein
MLMNIIVGAIHESPEENTLYRKMPYFVFGFFGRFVNRPYGLLYSFVTFVQLRFVIFFRYTLHKGTNYSVNISQNVDIRGKSHHARLS